MATLHLHVPKWLKAPPSPGTPGGAPPVGGGRFAALRSRLTPSKAIIFGGLLTLLLFWLIGLAVHQLILGYQNMVFGWPRASHMYAYVHHHERPGHPSLFFIVNDNRQLEVIETPGGDTSQVKTYLGPYLYGEDPTTPVSLEFRDVTNDNQPDMIIHVGDDFTSVLVNDMTTLSFRKPTDAEWATIQRALGSSVQQP